MYVSTKYIKQWLPGSENNNIGTQARSNRGMRNKSKSDAANKAGIWGAGWQRQVSLMKGTQKST